MPALRRLAVLEEGSLTSLAHNPEVLREFPFLVPLRADSAVQQRGGCCGRKQSPQRVDAVAAVKLSIALLNKAKLDALKKFLKADQVRITYRDGSGQIQSRTF